ncbi:integrase core domain protein [Teladorsagia circumcincta]|uniref:RNA-directed DNA polymerase n=1 Tax=Teladorsagia circumcincta TaxID=45464 RepID=A0A2G9T9L2_TELCI|nr:integrase core domain protein [Teladorsagia circumcincta]
MLARNYVYWTNINQDIEKFVKTCRRCQETAKSPVKTTLCSWPLEDKPWNRIHADFAGPLDGKMYLIVVDAYSKWPEIVEMSSTTTGSTIRELRRLFAQFGNPYTLVTDNGPQFTSKDFEDFCNENGVRHMKSPPFHPQSNGQAERFVDTFKRNFEKMKEDMSPNKALQNFLQTYRRTPCSSTPGGKSPAEVFLRREIRTKLSLLKPYVKSKDGTRNHRMEEQYNRHHGARQKEFNVGDLVWAMDYRSRKPQHTPGRILQRYGNRLYDVLIDGQVWKRHANQLRLNADANLQYPDSTPELADLPLLPTSKPNHLSKGQNLTQHEARTNTQPSSMDTSGAATLPTEEATGQRRIRQRRAPERLMVDPRKKTYA